jgi:CRP/FNR family transcriptional regulator
MQQFECLAPDPKAGLPACGLGGHCISVGSPLRSLARNGTVICSHKHVKRGETLYRAGDSLSSIYPIKAGFFKLYAVTEHGDEQVMGFYMGGEIMGLDAVATQTHPSTATAMEDSEVCVVPFDNFETLCTNNQALQQHFHRAMALEISKEQSMIVLLGGGTAEERVVSFLLNLSVRLLARGYSSSDFNLRMSREDIGSHLGLKLETVSRALSHLHEQGLLDVDGRHLRILDLPALQRLLGKTD